VSVERSGDRVLRPAAPWSESVQALLAHVRERGVTWVPQPQGLADGRAAVSWVEGDVPAYPMPEWVWAPAVLERAARMLRAYHDATAGFDRDGRTWALPAREPAEVICHNDFAPYNLAFRDGLPVGAIDFEAASPGPRAWDLAYLAYRLVPLADAANPDLPTSPEAERVDRLATLCAAYGGIDPSAVLALVPERLLALAENSPPAHAELYRADAAYARELTLELFGLRPDNSRLDA
jgi:hypothetical protein